MDDKEIRGAAVAALEAKRASMYGWLRGVTLSDAEVLDALSAANLLMTADALEAMEACVRIRKSEEGARLREKTSWCDADRAFDAAYDLGTRILAKREQEKGPRYVVEDDSHGDKRVRDTAAKELDYRSYRFFGTESECACVAQALNKHAGEKS